MRISEMVFREIEICLAECNFTNDEREIFELLTKKCTIVEISDKTKLSTATVSRRIKDIKTKIKKVVK